MQSKNEIRGFDIVPMVNFAWKNSFGRVDSNKKAIYERGWNPGFKSDDVKTREDR